MHVEDILSVEDVLRVAATDGRDLLRTLARHAAARFGLDADDVAGALMRREGLGSTGVGEGIALPHARLPGLDRARGVFAALARPVAFGAIDDRPVDLAFLLLLPAADPALALKPLACVARRLRHEGLAGRLRSAPDPAALFRLLVGD